MGGWTGCEALDGAGCGGCVFMQPVSAAGDVTAASFLQTEAIVPLLQSVRLGEELGLTGSFAQKKGRQLERLCSRIEVCVRKRA